MDEVEQAKDISRILRRTAHLGEIVPNYDGLLPPELSVPCERECGKCSVCYRAAQVERNLADGSVSGDYGG